MYKKQRPHITSIEVYEGYQGETIEDKINRIVNNKEPITDGAPLVYTNRNEGVQPAYDIRTDRFELATQAMDNIAKSHIAKREERGKVVPIDDKKDGGTEPIQGTNGTGDNK